MPTVSETIIVHHPPELTFNTTADPDIQLKWDLGNIQNVQKLSQGPLALNSRYRAKFKGFGTMEYTFGEFEPSRRFAHHVKLPIGQLRHIFTSEPDPQGTRLTQQGRLEPNLLGRLMWPVMSRMLKNRFHVIASEVDRYLSGQSPV